MHSFDRFYVVTKFILPSIGDLKFSKLNYDNTHAHLDNKNTHSTGTRKHMLDLMTFCKKIEPSVVYYKRLIKSYNHMAHNILENEINLIYTPDSKKTKMWNYHHACIQFHRISYEGISSFLHHKQNKALHMAVKAMDNKAIIPCNRLMQLENSMLMYGIYNVETLEKLINPVHNIHNTTSSHERLFVRLQSSLTLKSFYAYSPGLHHYSINCLLYLRTTQDKYIALYRELITQLQIYTSAIRILA